MCRFFKLENAVRSIMSDKAIILLSVRSFRSIGSFKSIVSVWSILLVRFICRSFRSIGSVKSNVSVRSNISDKDIIL